MFFRRKDDNFKFFKGPLLISDFDMGAFQRGLLEGRCIVMHCCSLFYDFKFVVRVSLLNEYNPNFTYHDQASIATTQKVFCEISIFELIIAHL